MSEVGRDQGQSVRKERQLQSNPPAAFIVMFLRKASPATWLPLEVI